MRSDHLIALALLGAAALTGCSSDDDGADETTATMTSVVVPDEAEQGLAALHGDADLRIILRRFATDDQLDEVRGALIAEPAVAGVDHISLEEATAEFAEHNPGQEPPEELSPAYRVDLDPTDEVDRVVTFIRELGVMPGVIVVAVDPEHRATGYNPDGPAGEVVVVFEPGAGDDEVADVRLRLDQSPDVAATELESQDEALDNFRRWFATDPVLVALTEAWQLPQTLILEPTGDPAEALLAACAVQGDEGVREVAGYFAGARPCGSA